MKKLLIQKLFNRIGLQVKPYPDPDLKRRLKIIHHYGVDTLLDIGAATGEYVEKMRECGYKNRIISFEPLKDSFSQLQKKAARDKAWEIYNYALGSQEGRATINVSSNSDSSSLLNMLPEHEAGEPLSRYVRQEEIEIKRLDSVYEGFCSPQAKVMVKIDVQGFEKSVLEGANECLQSVGVIQLEMSLVPLYEQQPLFTEMIGYLSEKGFQLFSLENGFANLHTGQLLQVDGIFVKRETTRRKSGVQVRHAGHTGRNE